VTEQPTGAVAAQLERAETALASARLLRDAGLLHDAVSRAYYGMFHAACALLASIGRSVKTHDGLRAQLGEHFVKPGLLAAEHARSLARIAGDRGDADYNVSSVFEIGDVDDDLARAAAFVRAVRAILGNG
jgi:uncharacterized protein (UPF0332 family)